MKLKNVLLAIKDQGLFSRFVRNLLKGHLFGLVSKRSCINANGNPKIPYSSKKSAIKAAEAMSKKRGLYFSNYKCMRCDGFHIGKNSSNKSKN